MTENTTIAPESVLGAATCRQIGREAQTVEIQDDDGALRTVAGVILANDAIAKQYQEAKRELSAALVPYWLTFGAGKKDQPKTLLVPCDGGAVQAVFVNRYPAVVEDRIPDVRAICGRAYSHLFAPTFQAHISWDGLAPETQETLVSDLKKVLAKHGVSPEALSTTTGACPVKEFHVERHTRLSLTANLRLDELCPVSVRLTAKPGYQPLSSTIGVLKG